MNGIVKIRRKRDVDDNFSFPRRLSKIFDHSGENIKSILALD